MLSRKIGTAAIAVLAAMFAVSGCGSKEPAVSTPASKTEAPKAPALESAGDTATHAAEGVVPGSYEDWCGEHAVAESQCTRCNASLIPAFKATGDWCAEHGLPESQCLACNPHLQIVRPPKPAGA